MNRMLVILGCLFTLSPVALLSAGDGILCSFENEMQIGRVTPCGVKTTLVAEHVTDGKKAFDAYIHRQPPPI